MHLALLPHPDFAGPPVRSIAVEAERAGNRLCLRYRLTGTIGALVVPPPAAAERADGLWRHSCFEAFVRPIGGQRYCELNLSPSRQWAAYSFDGYRSGMKDLPIPCPAIELQRDGDRLELQAELELDEPGTWQLGLCAVIEEAGGGLSYWALRHPPGKPDFHHRDCFALDLPPAG
jgi:hypothetical protein